jgi:hypothetical protein
MELAVSCEYQKIRINPCAEKSGCAIFLLLLLPTTCVCVVVCQGCQIIIDTKYQNGILYVCTKNIPNCRKINQMATQSIPNGHKRCQKFPFKGHQKCTKNWGFGLKMNHLATPLCCVQGPLYCSSFESNDSEYAYRPNTKHGQRTHF